MDSTQAAEPASYSQDYWNPASKNSNYSPSSALSADNWDEWKAQKNQGDVVYVNPGFIQGEKILIMSESDPKLESPEPRKGPKTPAEETESNQDYQVYLDDDSDHEGDVIVDGTVMTEEVIEGDTGGKEAGEIEDEEEEQSVKTIEKSSDKAPKTKTSSGPLLHKASDKESSSSSPQPKKRRRSRSPSKKSRRSRSQSRSRKTKRPEKGVDPHRETHSTASDWPMLRQKLSAVTNVIASSPLLMMHLSTRFDLTTPVFRVLSVPRYLTVQFVVTVLFYNILIRAFARPSSNINLLFNKIRNLLQVLTSPAKLVNHIEKYHGPEKVRCRFCDEKFGGRAEGLSHAQWNDFREHVFREMLRRKVKDYNNRCPDTTVLRGVGRCPHGPPIKCRNFPKCPGARCIYSHGRCDFADTCNLSRDCPFDHPNRPRVCMACVKDLKSSSRRRTRSPPSRARE